MSKNLLKKVFTTIALLLAITFVIFLVMRYTDSIVDADQNIQMSAVLDDNSCLVCHTSNAELPIYSSLPIIGEQVMLDIDNGKRAFNMDNMIERVVSEGLIGEVELAKIENVIAKGTMPLAKFNIIHWGSYINSNEKELITNWVRNVRSANYSTSLASEEFKHKAVQPLTEKIEVNSDKVALGNKMFHDTRLSIDNTISCSSCHLLDKGGVDNKRYSEGVDNQFGDINAPTVYNAAFNFIQFWDGRADDLAMQAGGPPVNPVEMGAHTWGDICSKLNTDKALVAQFKNIYNTENITEAQVTDVIAEFEKTLITPDTRFDNFLKGDKMALNSDEIKGFELFEQYDCHTCHVGQNLGGQSFEYLGLYNDYLGDRGDMIKADNGRFNISNDDLDLHKFKTPTLRNIELTHPYFHDGTVLTLEDAVEKMVVYQTVNNTITTDEVSKITSFLKSLTSQKLMNN